jgi:hypothetical protein
VSNNATIFEGSNEVGQDVEGLFPECECFTSRIHALASRDERALDLMIVYCVHQCGSGSLCKSPKKKSKPRSSRLFVRSLSLARSCHPFPHKFFQCPNLEKAATTSESTQESCFLLDGDRILTKPQRHGSVAGDQGQANQKKIFHETCFSKTISDFF